jgi:hypothetical protein
MYFDNTDASGHQMEIPIQVSISNNKYFGSDFVIADMSSDTIYKLTKNKELTPLIVRTPSVHASEPRTVWSSKLTTDQFILLSILTLDFEAMKQMSQNLNQGGGSLPSTDFMYEFATGEMSEVSFVNDDFPSGRAWSPTEADIPQKNMAVSMIQMVTLQDALEEKKLKGDLEKLVASLDEDDNPVVMIVKFR